MQLLDGRKVSSNLLDHLRTDVENLKGRNVSPRLVVILVGNDPRSSSYIKQKTKACEKTGISCDLINLDESIDTESLLEKIKEYNVDNSVHGILVQLPLPDHINVPLVIRAIDPNKDVDGFHAYNLGKMFLSTEFEFLAPCTPMGVIKMLEYYDIDIKGQDVTVVGHSNIVGKPMSTMLLNRDATVTTCHVHTKDLKYHTKNADILIVAVGKAGLISEDMVKDGAIVIDVGCNEVDGKICGDVDFDNVSKKALFITPVPGGAGPMTVACLMENVVKAAKRLNNINS